MSVDSISGVSAMANGADFPVSSADPASARINGPENGNAIPPNYADIAPGLDSPSPSLDARLSGKGVIADLVA